MWKMSLNKIFFCLLFFVCLLLVFIPSSKHSVKQIREPSVHDFEYMYLKYMYLKNASTFFTLFDSSGNHTRTVCNKSKWRESVLTRCLSGPDREKQYSLFSSCALLAHETSKNPSTSRSAKLETTTQA